VHFEEGRETLPSRFSLHPCGRRGERTAVRCGRRAVGWGNFEEGREEGKPPMHADGRG